jgi:hypothetical protein
MKIEALDTEWDVHWYEVVGFIAMLVLAALILGLKP